jgi:hypothetical protein
MSTLSIQRLRYRDPAAVDDDVGVRVLGHRKSPSGRMVVEIELDLPPSTGQPPPVARAPVRRRSASPVPGDERRAAAMVAISVLGGFALVSVFASLIAILL